MRVTIDGRLAGQRLGGITTYIRELCAALASQPDDLTITVLYARRGEPLPIANGARQRPCLTPAHHRWEGLAFGLEAAATWPDLLHSPDVVPPAARACRSVITVHDLAFLYWPEILDPDGRRHYGQIHQAVASADHIIAVSTTTQRALGDLLGVSAARVTVVPEAAGPAFRPVPPTERRAALAAAQARPAVRARVLGERGPYLLVVGTLEPRKNLPFLLRTYDRLATDWPAAPDLVLAGRLGWLAEETLATLASLTARERVEWIDGPTTPELALLYAGALALAFPSRYEGFGLPVLEAMACGTPVLATDGSALREQVADAGWLLPLDDRAAWGEALRTIGQDVALRERLAEAGQRRVAGYSWARTAAATSAVYRRVASHA